MVSEPMNFYYMYICEKLKIGKNPIDESQARHTPLSGDALYPPADLIFCYVLIW